MTTLTDPELREALAPMRELEPSPAQVAAARAAVPGRRATTRRRALVAIPVATAAVVAGLAALPAGPQRAGGPDGASVLRAAAAVADDQPPAFSGVRYAEVLDTWTYANSTGTLRFTVPSEQWIDRDFDGEVLVQPSIDVERTHRSGPASGAPAAAPDPGDPSPPRELPLGGKAELLPPGRHPFQIGDGPSSHIRVDELPTDPAALRAALLEQYRSVKWAPGHPTRAQERYDLTRTALTLLGIANTTPAQRAGLFEMLASFDRVDALGTVRDPLGREAAGVDIGQEATTIRLLFDPRSSLLLSWSERPHEGAVADSQVHTYVRSGQVARIGDRPEG